MKIILFLLFSFTLQAQVTPVAKWNSLLTDFNLDGNDHSYCYIENGELKGRNIYKKVRLASVSKLITTYWAIKKLKDDYHYQTKIFYKNGKMFIKGDLDPLISDRKLFYLIAQLNKIGITHIKELIFDSKFKVFTKAEKYHGSILNVAPSRTAANLKDFLNTKSWNKLLTKYNSFIQAIPFEVITKLNLIENVKDLDLTVDKVTFSNSSEIENEENNLEKYIMSSSQISKYMKFMNIVSNNYMADQIYKKLGGEVEFDKFINKDLHTFLLAIKGKATSYTKDENLIKLFTGSGLNTIRNKSRVDNFANCGIVVEIIKRLDKEMQRLNNQIWNIAAVPGTDLGTFRKRLKSKRLKDTMIAKTGTLYHTCAIAGMINNTNKVYFGIFHQVRGWKGNVRIMQDKTITYLWEYLGENNNNGKISKFSYKPKYFFPAEDNLVTF